MITFSTEKVSYQDGSAIIYSFGWDGCPPVMSIVADQGTLVLLSRDFRNLGAEPEQWDLVCLRGCEVFGLPALRQVFGNLFLDVLNLPQELSEAIVMIPPFVRREFVRGLWQQVCCQVVPHG